MVMLLAGTTFAGHDWNTGSMSNQLLFEPRRHRVWLAKAIAVALLTGTISLAVLIAYWTGMWATASIRDLPIPDHAVSAAYKQAVLGAGFATAAARVRLRADDAAPQHGRDPRDPVRRGLPLHRDRGRCARSRRRIERVMPWGNFYAYAVGAYQYYDYDTCGFGADGGNCATGDHHARRLAHLLRDHLVVVTVPSLLSHRVRTSPLTIALTHPPTNPGDLAHRRRLGV